MVFRFVKPVGRRDSEGQPTGFDLGCADGGKSGGPPKNGNEKTNGAGQGAKAVIEAEAIPPATVEAIRQEAAQVAEDATFIVEAEEPTSEGSGFYAQDVEVVREPNGSAATPAPSEASSMDDLVAK